MQIWRVVCIGLLLLGWPARFADADAPPSDALPDGCTEIGGTLVRSIDPIDASAWKFINEKQQAANVKGLKEFADQAISQTHRTLRLNETPHFLIYTDIGSELAHEDGTVLESAYNTLARFFDLHVPIGAADRGQGKNIWHGKAVFFIFRDTQLDAANDFATQVHPWPDGQAPRMTQKKFHSIFITLNGNGSVDVLTTQSDAEKDETRLVCALGEAFLYRLRSPRNIETWVEGGLAGALEKTTPYPHLEAQSPGLNARLLQQSNDVAQSALDSGDFDDLVFKHPDPRKMLSLYTSLNAYMLRKNAHRYAAFVLALKDGKPLEQSLEREYGMTDESLKAAYTAMLSDRPGHN